MKICWNCHLQLLWIAICLKQYFTNIYLYEEMELCTYHPRLLKYSPIQWKLMFLMLLYVIYAYIILFWIIIVWFKQKLMFLFLYVIDTYIILFWIIIVKFSHKTMFILITCIEAFEFLGFSGLDSYWPVQACSTASLHQAPLGSTCPISYLCT
jgi:hypothetical protein